MNTEMWVNIVSFVVLPIVGFIISFLIGWIVSIQKDLRTLTVNIAENYPKKGELKEALDKIEKVLEKIFERINSIAERRSDRRQEEDADGRN